ncbi:CatB-related O-acetyltransferase [Amorphus coralli]|uniref:CatB-related O-acetyltransferase n=1 Tax=Amorphus coralli TaxID=340680 RepID=UPI00036BE912|nr:CatB-related O-acetyltransferase [Amorphus coralli]
MPLLNPNKTHPMAMPDGTVIEQTVQLKAVIDHPRIEVGDFSYYHNFEILQDYAAFLAPYLFPPSPEKLTIGKFCQFAHGVRFITSTANHDMSGFSTYPFQNFMMTPETTMDDIVAMFHVPGRKGDTVVGNDVWMGMDCMVMPGVTIGDGVICAARSVIARDVPPYSIVAGNPARPVRRRFDDATIAALQEIRWWDWPVEAIEAHHAVITGADLDALRRIADEVACR